MTAVEPPQLVEPIEEVVEPAQDRVERLDFRRRYDRAQYLLLLAELGDEAAVKGPAGLGQGDLEHPLVLARALLDDEAAPHHARQGATDRNLVEHADLADLARGQRFEIGEDAQDAPLRRRQRVGVALVDAG